MHLLCARSRGADGDPDSELCHLSFNIWSRDRDRKSKMKHGNRYLCASVESVKIQSRKASITKYNIWKVGKARAESLPGTSFQLRLESSVRRAWGSLQLHRGASPGKLLPWPHGSMPPMLLPTHLKCILSVLSFPCSTADPLCALISSSCEMGVIIVTNSHISSEDHDY